VEKVKNFQRNYLESEKFFSKFSYFLELKGKNFQNLKVTKFPEIPKSGKKVKIFNEIILKVKNFSLSFRIFLKVKIFKI
jgi:hypothetical protein